MMYLNNLMESKNMTRSELRERTGIPESTLRDILNGKAQLDRCESNTLFKIARALNVSMESILEHYWQDDFATHNPNSIMLRDTMDLSDFYALVSTSLGLCRECGCLLFMESIRRQRLVERFFAEHHYMSALFLQGLADYISRTKNLPSVPMPEQLVNCRLDIAVFSMQTEKKIKDGASYAQAVKSAVENAIPELARFNIYMTEADVRC